MNLSSAQDHGQERFGRSCKERRGRQPVPRSPEDPGNEDLGLDVVSVQRTFVDLVVRPEHMVPER
jgi:hypothetical protein